MKWSRVLLAFGVVLLLAGLYSAVFGGLVHSPTDRTFSIPAGAYFYGYYKESLSAGQTIRMDFTVTGGSTVDVFILNEAQWSDYSYDLSSASLASASGSHGSVSFNVETGGTYYLAIDHGSGYSSSTQEGKATINITGTNTGCLMIGAAIVVVGVLMLVGGFIRGKKEAGEAKDLWQQQQQTAGVVYYHDQQPPNQPPAQPPQLRQ